ncbi:hypothetical protein BGZ91_011372 [Linnemannia elongata]|nr:hypothetical protein BGZ91_011372 [Linnemannia elongata]
MAVQPANRLKFSFQSKHSSAEISQFLAETDNKDLFFSLSYWDIASVGSTARDLLEYAGVKHENITPTEFNMAESAVIDTFLAERFGLLGNNTWEAMTIRAFYTNMQYLRERTFSETLSVKSSEKKKARDQFLSQSLRKFLEDHEFHLQENGCNGHYVGDKLSLADLHLNNIIHFYSTVPWAKMALDEFKKYEAVWKVKETVDRVTELYEWRTSNVFKAYEKGSHDHYAQCAVPEDDLAEK